MGNAITTSNRFVDDLNKVAEGREPDVTANIDLVYVLSGRWTVLRNNADHLERPTDQTDDFLRVCKGIRIADKINALKVGKHVHHLTDADRITPIFYNGRASIIVTLEKQFIQEG